MTAVVDLVPGTLIQVPSWNIFETKTEFWKHLGQHDPAGILLITHTISVVGRDVVVGGRGRVVVFGRGGVIDWRVIVVRGDRVVIGTRRVVVLECLDDAGHFCSVIAPKDDIDKILIL